MLPNILTFIDETFLGKNSGLIQSALVVPQDYYVSELVPRSQILLKKLGDNAQEFRGININRSNKDIYLEFLQNFTSLVAQLNLSSGVKSIVTIEPREIEYFEDLNLLKKLLEDFIRTLGTNDFTKFSKNFSSQLKWFHSHFNKISDQTFTNHIYLIFDNKSATSKEIKKIIPIKIPGDKTIYFKSLEYILILTANYIANKVILPPRKFPTIKGFTFENSQQEFGLQAADLISHLFNTAIKYKIGIATKTSEIKMEIFNLILPECPLDESFQSRFEVCRENDGQHSAKMINPETLTFQLSSLESGLLNGH